MVDYYKHPKFGHVYGTPIPTPVVRVAWLQLVTPKAKKPSQSNPNPEPKYQVTFILPKDAETTKVFLAHAKKMTDEMLVLFNQKRAAALSGLKLLWDGDDETYYKKETYPFYANSWIIAATNKNKIATFDGRKVPIDAATVLGGMFCTGVVVPLITASGVSWRAEVLQLVKDDGTRFGGGRPDASSYLDEISGDAPNEEAPFEGGKTVVAAADKAPPVLPQVTVQTVMPDGKKKALDLL